MNSYEETLWNRRINEAKIMWLNMISDGFRPGSVAAFELTFFTKASDDAQRLIDALAEHRYTAMVDEQMQQGHYIIEGTSRPYAYDFNDQEFISWVEFMVNLGFQNNAVFANWTTSCSEPDKSWDSQDIA